MPLQIQTGSRLHFGLMELCKRSSHCFAGLGLMLDWPRLTLTFHDNDRNGQAGDRAVSDLESRISASMAEWEKRTGRMPPTRNIQLDSRFPLHCGLGTGTQLACSAAIGLDMFDRQMRELKPTSQEAMGWHRCLDAWPLSQNQAATILQQASGRGLRSAIGLEGFLRGGLILDEGYPASECERPGAQGIGQRPIRTRRIGFPDSWRIVLLLPHTDQGVSGLDEASLLDDLASQPHAAQPHMRELAEAVVDCLAANVPQFDRFSKTLEGYLDLASRMFESVQGGRYRNQPIAQAAQAAVDVGLRGVGQSSWGPIVFGFAENHQRAEECVQSLMTSLPITSPTMSAGECGNRIPQIPPRTEPRAAAKNDRDLPNLETQGNGTFSVFVTRANNQGAQFAWLS